MVSEVSLILIPCVNQPASMSMLLAEEETSALAGLFLRPEFGDRGSLTAEASLCV